MLARRSPRHSHLDGLRNPFTPVRFKSSSKPIIPSSFINSTAPHVRMFPSSLVWTYYIRHASCPHHIISEKIKGHGIRENVTLLSTMLTSQYAETVFLKGHNGKLSSYFPRLQCVSGEDCLLRFHLTYPHILRPPFAIFFSSFLGARVTPSSTLLETFVRRNWYLKKFFLFFTKNGVAKSYLLALLIGLLLA